MKEDTRQKIVDVSLSLFSRYGLGNTKITDIIKYSGISKGTFYNYFRSKEEIFLTILEREIDRNESALKAALDEQADPYKKLTVFFVFSVNGIRRILKLLNIRLGEFDLLPIMPRTFIEQRMKRGLDIIKSILADGVDKGVFEVDDPDLAAYMIQRTVDVFIDPFHVMRGQAGALEEEADRVVRLFFFGISKRREGSARS
jgi:AcrR family transcriptional regulator